MKKISALIIISGLFVVGTIYYGIFVWEYSGPTMKFIVEDGEGFSRINARLYNEGFSYSPRLFHHYYRLFVDEKLMIKSGEYTIPEHTTMYDLFPIIQKGGIESIAITIPEGKNLYEIARALEGAGVAGYREFVNSSKDPRLLQELGISFGSAEGFLYPDTYRFAKSTSAEKVIRVMVNEFKKKTENLKFRNHAYGLSPEQIIVLASIVEKETGAAHERRTVAGVFMNRLLKKIRLQSDPTVIYGNFEDFKGNIKKEDLENKNAYNTYRINGLPIGPIANPGRDAIEAVINPSRSLATATDHKIEVLY
ncbi:MAG: endolytic transglycosylase MltG, partial [Oligoflexia bacterium]|nr:endolytic transglycosylase MltG [Oligoflexia bacterium]